MSNIESSNKVEAAFITVLVLLGILFIYLIVLITLIAKR